MPEKEIFTDCNVSLEQEDFYYFNSGPFTVRVFATHDLVEPIGRVYLANNKYFGFEMDYALDMDILPVEPLKLDPLTQQITTKEPCLISMNADRFNPSIEVETFKKRVSIAAGQLVLFNAQRYTVQKR